MKKEYAKYLLEKTAKDYNLIAEQFSNSRYSVWPEFNLFGKYIIEGEKILDLGCGNGRLFEIFQDKKVDYVGVDNSEKLIEIAKKKHPKIKFQKTDGLILPFPDNYFDKIFCIAVLHHIPSGKFRRQFLKEARRVLKSEGFLVITVWNLWQRKIAWKLFLKYTFLKLVGRSKIDFMDIFYPWKRHDGKILIQRYFHIFSKNSLKTLVQKSGFILKETALFKREETKNYNIYLIAKK